MTEYPVSSKVVKSLRYRDELNRILQANKPTNGERLFLACFLKDQCGWEATAISLLICEKASWQDLDVRVTNRNVDRIFARHIKYHGSRHPGIQMERSQGETQQGKNFFKKKVETCRCCDSTTIKKNSCHIGFQVSTEYPGPYEQGENEMDQTRQQPKTIRTAANIHNGSKFYRIVEKEGQYGTFYSLESGWINDCEYEGKMIKVSGRPEKFFTLPADNETLKKLSDGILSLLPEEKPARKK